MHTVVETKNLIKRYGEKNNQFRAINQVNLTIKQGEFISLYGPSGSGKTTLLNLLSGLDQPSSGQVWLQQTDLAQLTAAKRADMRLNHLGFVFQAYNLIPVLTALENVEFIMQLQGIDKVKRQQQALDMLSRVGLADFIHRRPGQLSGGQQQRVAIARAMASQPDIIFADEPSANLDSKSTESLLALMQSFNQDFGTTFCITSHDPKVIAATKRQIKLVDGQITDDQICH